MGLSNFSKIVRDFLFSNLNKQFLTFMSFLAISAIFWLVSTLNANYEKELKIPVQIRQIPKNVVLTSDEVDTIRVTVRDKGWTILA